MLFSSPDFPVYLLAVFFLHALGRWGRGAGGGLAAAARLALLVLLGDVVVVLVGKDVGALWDPIGGALLGLAATGAADGPTVADVLAHAWQWPIGLAVVVAAIRAGRRHGATLASPAGQRALARGLVVVLAALAVAVSACALRDAWRAPPPGAALGPDDPAPGAAVAALVAGCARGGHLVVLLVLGVGLGAAREARTQQLGRALGLFVVSSLFYQAWAAEMPGAYRLLLGLLLGTIALDYYLALWIEGAASARARRALLLVSVASNLGILGFFKYADFFAQDVLHLPVGRLDLILPAGISFHTFQSLSYTIDVYRGELRATRSIVTFATFVLFFPQLVAGPIVRAQELLPQLEEVPPVDAARARAALFRIAVGLFKKIALADRLALIVVDRVFEAPARFSSVEVLAGVYGYALQIYLDFSAYSDIAIGAAELLGFTLPENFRTPYRAANLQEFWRRWHISLSTWLRDNLYIPLGGARGAPWMTYRNLVATMVLGGLWHGASWRFIVWGALHGLGLAVTRVCQRRAAAPAAARRAALACAGLAVAGVAVTRAALADAGTWTQLVVLWACLTPLWAALTAWLSAPVPAGPRRGGPARVVLALRGAVLVAGLALLAALRLGPASTWLPAAAACWALAAAADVVERGGVGGRSEALGWARRALAVVLVFHYVCLAWIFFRAESFARALEVLRRLAAGEGDHANLVPVVVLSLAVGLGAHFFPSRTFAWLGARFAALPAWAQGLGLAAAALVLCELSVPTLVQFIYFQF